VGGGTDLVAGFSYTWPEINEVFKKQWQVCPEEETTPEQSHLEPRFDPKTGAPIDPVKVIDVERRANPAITKQGYFLFQSEFERYLQHPSAHCRGCWTGTNAHSCGDSPLSNDVYRDFPDIESCMDDHPDGNFLAYRLAEYIGNGLDICLDGSTGDLVTIPVKGLAFNKTVGTQDWRGRTSSYERGLIDLDKIGEVSAEIEEVRSKIAALSLPARPLTVSTVWYE
jgi:hypothetical protein